MLTAVYTTTYTKWIRALRDQRAQQRISAAVLKFQAGLGDTKSVGDRVSELRVDYGPGYRVYFTTRGAEVVILLCGGDKSSQARDIATAKGMVADL
jgi:putative addiction module killer protein